MPIGAAQLGWQQPHLGTAAAASFEVKDPARFEPRGCWRAYSLYCAAVPCASNHTMLTAS
jgi:hypothetical protein